MQGVFLRAANLARRAVRIAIVLAMAATALLLAACTSEPNLHPTTDGAPPNGFPATVATSQGQQSASLYPIVFAIAVVIFILVEGLIVLIAIRFRRKKTDVEFPPQTHGNNVLEILWTVIPAFVVIVIFILSMSVLVNVQADSATPSVTVDVTGFQWQWNFAYPDLKSASGQPLSYTGAGKDGPQMVLPTNETVRIRLQSKDVIHSFYVPQFFYKLDVIPGRTNEFEITIKDPGTYGGQCAEFCGLAHSEMFFSVKAVSPADFQTWVTTEEAKASATPAPAPSGAATVEVTAISASAGFQQKTLTAPANTPLTIQFANQDPTVVHNFAIKGGNADGSDWIGLPPIQGGQSGTYQAPALKPGTYTFFCAIHPTTMTGTLTVGP